MSFVKVGSFKNRFLYKMWLLNSYSPSDNNSFKLNHILYLIFIGVLSLVGLGFKENAITIMVSKKNFEKKFFNFPFSFQPFLAAVDILRNFKRLKPPLPKTLIIRLVVLMIFTVSILFLRLKVQNFEVPKFRNEDNPGAFAAHHLTRVLTQNYLYSFNTFLLLLPDGLAFDWSFDSIELVHNLKDFRMIFIMIFYLCLISTVFRGLKKR